VFYYGRDSLLTISFEIFLLVFSSRAPFTTKQLNVLFTVFVDKQKRSPIVLICDLMIIRYFLAKYVQIVTIQQSTCKNYAELSALEDDIKYV